MKTSRFHEHQNIAILKQGDVVIKARDLCRRMALTMQPTSTGTRITVA